MTDRTLDPFHILVVEDDPIIASSLKEDLEDFGATIVGPVKSVQQAISCIAEADRLDAAVLDINLGGERAYPIANDLRRRKIPFVFLTGYDRTPVAVHFEDVPVFEKPADPEALADALLRALKPN